MKPTLRSMDLPPPAGKPVARRNNLAAQCGLAAALVFGAAGLQAQQPTGGTVVSGSASISAVPGTTTVTAGNNSILRWGSFNVGMGETVQFVQPGTDARVLNWIGGLTPSQIDGALLANGQVYLLNPSGVYFGRTAVVDVGRLYAIGGSLSKDDFLAGLDRFTSLTGVVRNDGSLRGSAVALIGRRWSTRAPLSHPMDSSPWALASRSCSGATVAAFMWMREIPLPRTPRRLQRPRSGQFRLDRCRSRFRRAGRRGSLFGGHHT